MSTLKNRLVLTLPSDREILLQEWSMGRLKRLNVWRTAWRVWVRVERILDF